MSRFRGAWQSLNFDKEYLFGFETLVFATSGSLSTHNQLVTLQQARAGGGGGGGGGGEGAWAPAPFAQSALLSRQFFFLTPFCEGLPNLTISKIND